MKEYELHEKRKQLVRVLRLEGIDDERILDAIETVPRHEFLPQALWQFAYDNRPLPIGRDQTISQPYIVALMSQLASIGAGDRVLEIGTGSGYQAAILAMLGADVFTVEIIPELAERARHDLERLNLARNVHFCVSDGYDGWPEQAPFDAILVTAAPAAIPEPLIAQLRTGGRLVVPVGTGENQELRVLTRGENSLETNQIIAVRFVPMTGRALELS